MIGRRKFASSLGAILVVGVASSLRAASDPSSEQSPSNNAHPPSNAACIPPGSFLYARFDSAQLVRDLTASGIGQALAREDAQALLAHALPPGSRQEIDTALAMAQELGPIELSVRGLQLEMHGRTYMWSPNSPASTVVVNALISWSSVIANRPHGSEEPKLVIVPDFVLRFPNTPAFQQGFFDSPWQEMFSGGTPTEMAGRKAIRVESPVEGQHTLVRLYRVDTEDSVYFGGSEDSLAACLVDQGEDASQHPLFGEFGDRASGAWARGWVDYERLFAMVRPLLPPLLWSELEQLGITSMRGVAAASSFADGAFTDEFATCWGNGPRGICRHLSPADREGSGSRLRLLERTPADATAFLGWSCSFATLFAELAEFADEFLADGGALRHEFLRQLGQEVPTDELARIAQAFGSEVGLFAKVGGGVAFVPDGVLTAELGDAETWSQFVSTVQSILTQERFDVSEPPALAEGIEGIRIRPPDLPMPIDAVWDERWLQAGNGMTLRRWRGQLSRLTPEQSLAADAKFRETATKLDLEDLSDVSLLAYADLPTVLGTYYPLLPIQLARSGAGGVAVPPWSELEGHFEPAMLALEHKENATVWKARFAVPPLALLAIGWNVAVFTSNVAGPGVWEAELEPIR